MEALTVSHYSPDYFALLREKGGLELTPKFQRKNVWKTPARSYLIDSLIRRMVVPPLYLREVQAEDYARPVCQVVDGQQRLNAVLDYLDGKYALVRQLDSEYRGKAFEELPPEIQGRIRNYSFICHVLHGVSDEEVLEIFRRVNLNSVPLNNQELRNGKYFGYFKQAAYELADAYLAFWRTHRVFSEDGIARMLEVEFTSELLIAELDGMQDKKKSIDRFYADYDQGFPQRKKMMDRFHSTMATLADVAGDVLRDMEFRRPPLLYSLFCSLYHRLFGLPSCSLPRSRSARITRSAVRNAAGAVHELSDIVAAAKDKEPVPEAYRPFVLACAGQTDNIGPRRIRMETIYREAFGV